MFKRNHFLLLTLAPLWAASANAECVPPDVVSVPDGAKATEEEMTTGQDYIRDFMTANEQYRKCLDDQVASLGEEATDEQRASSTQLYNLSVDREQALVENYNEQVRAFNEANP